MRPSFLAIALVAFSSVTSSSLGQSPSMEKYEPAEMLAESKLLPDLRFATIDAPLEASTNLSNAILKPAGMSIGVRHPALVLMHRCSGIQDREMRYWVDAALQRGYVVLVVDSLRGNRTNCVFPLAVASGRRIKDAFDALQHLAGLSYIDPSKIFAAGFSQGGFIASLLSSREVASAFSPGSGVRFAAATSFYGHCKYPAASIPGIAYSIDIVRQDTDRPLLLLMGELDNETPPSTCEEILQTLQARAAPVTSHIYPGTTHCWDCITRDGVSRTDFRGTKVTYRFDRAVTENSVSRMFDFLAK
jgi:dienelactone hydrolase